MGGKFADVKPKGGDGGLTRWFNEEWVNQKGNVGYQKKGDIYRPSKRITSKTPITWNELTPSEIKKLKRLNQLVDE